MTKSGPKDHSQVPKEVTGPSRITMKSQSQARPQRSHGAKSKVPKKSQNQVRSQKVTRPSQVTKSYRTKSDPKEVQDQVRSHEITGPSYCRSQRSHMANSSPMEISQPSQVPKKSDPKEITQPGQVPKKSKD